MHVPVADGRELTIAAYHEQLRTGGTTVQATVEAYLDRIDRLDRRGPELNAVVTTNDQAVERAKRLDARLADDDPIEPLFGVPVLVKDQAMTAGLETTFGSTAFEGYVPDRSATVVEQLDAAGAVLLGKTNLPDFAAGLAGYSSVAGQTRNPYALDRDPGGSSAGTGTAVAANLCLVGIGEDTGGSIRAPASFCNLFGLYPTTGLVSRDGFSPLMPPQDSPGPMTRTVDDLARVLDVIVSFDPADEATAIHASWDDSPSFVDSLDPGALEGARIGVLRSRFGPAEDPEAAAVTGIIEEALSTMASAGATIVDPVEIPDLDSFLEETSLYEYVPKHALTTFFRELGDAPVDSFDAVREANAYHPRLELLDTIAEGPADPTDSRTYWQRLATRNRFGQHIQTRLCAENLDAIAFPSMQVPPPRFAGYHTGELTRADVPSNTFIASQSGSPSISVPAGFTDDGLPIGVELLGAPFSDRRLVALAAAYEAVATPRRPPALTESTD